MARIIMETLRRTTFALVGMGALAACSATSYPAHAQSQDNIPVIVMGEDEDPRSVSRKSDIYKRVLAELKDGMFRHGFRMRDEEMIAADLGWKVVDRRPKTELIEAAKLANNEAKANLRSRALALFRIHATKKDVGYAHKIETRIDGELYDLRSNTFIGTFELPRSTYSAPANCNAVCISEVVGDKAREIAVGIGDVLGKKLAYLSPKQTAGGGTASVGNGDGRCKSMTTSYTVTFKRFDTPETFQAIGTMAEEFPCYESHDLMPGKTSALRKYEYVSTATPVKLEEWINIMLMDMGLDPDRDVEIIFSGDEFILDKIISRPKNETVPDGGKYN